MSLNAGSNQEKTKILATVILGGLLIISGTTVAILEGVEKLPEIYWVGLFGYIGWHTKKAKDNE